MSNCRLEMVVIKHLLFCLISLVSVMEHVNKGSHSFA